MTGSYLSVRQLTETMLWDTTWMLTRSNKIKISILVPCTLASFLKSLIGVWWVGSCGLVALTSATLFNCPSSTKCSGIVLVPNNIHTLHARNLVWPPASPFWKLFLAYCIRVRSTVNNCFGQEGWKCLISSVFKIHFFSRIILYIIYVTVYYVFVAGMICSAHPTHPQMGALIVNCKVSPCIKFASFNIISCQLCSGLS